MEELTVGKILDYYASLLNLSSNVVEKEKLDQYRELYNNTEIDESKNTVVLHVGNNRKHDCKIIIEESVIDWTLFRDTLIEHVSKNLVLIRILNLTE